MPVPASHKHSKSTSVSNLSVLDAEKVGIDGPAVPPVMSAVEADSALAHGLQPLLEQEALLECVFDRRCCFMSHRSMLTFSAFYRSFIQEASAQRKFEDVKSLKVNLNEIRNEINRMASSSDIKL